MNQRIVLMALGCLCCWAWLPGPANAQTDGLKLKAQLVWGTDQPKPKDENLKPLNKDLVAKLRRKFKWKDYWVINTVDTGVISSSTERIRMSDKCQVEMRRLDAATLELKLIGEGKLVTTIRQQIKSLERGEYSILGGEDKEHRENAWFVILSIPRPASHPPR